MNTNVYYLRVLQRTHTKQRKIRKYWKSCHGGGGGGRGEQICGKNAPRYGNLTIDRIYPVKYTSGRFKIVKNYVLRRNLGFIPPSSVFFFCGQITLWAISRDNLKGQDYFDPLTCPFATRCPQFSFLHLHVKALNFDCRQLFYFRRFFWECGT